MSSGICLVGMVLFALTGITLNHAGDIEADPVTISRNATMPASVLERLRGRNSGPVPRAPAAWLHDNLGINVNRRFHTIDEIVS